MNFPPICLIFFASQNQAPQKTSQKTTDLGQTEAPFPLLPIFTPCTPPPAYGSIHERSSMESAILAMSRHNARRAQCRDAVRAMRSQELAIKYLLGW